jgi:hypothetical protein
MAVHLRLNQEEEVEKPQTPEAEEPVAEAPAKGKKK